jgi:hypothetical protein
MAVRRLLIELHCRLNSTAKSLLKTLLNFKVGIDVSRKDNTDDNAGQSPAAQNTI